MSDCNNWCNTTQPDFKTRLARATKFYANTLSDRDDNPAGTYDEFGNLIAGDDSDTEYYCYIFNETTGKSFIESSVLQGSDMLSMWLAEIDKILKDSFPDYRFSHFTGSDWINGKNNRKGRCIEAVIKKHNFY